MKRPYKVRIRTEYIVELTVLASDEYDAEELALEGRETAKDTIMTDIEILEINEVENDRFAEE